jgi:hypothetical protein
MPSQIVCIRLPKQLHTALTAFCARQGQPPSAVMRGALRDLLAHPERWADILLQRDADLHAEMPTTWEAATEGPEACDLAAVLAQSCVDLSTWVQETIVRR